MFDSLKEIASNLLMSQLIDFASRTADRNKVTGSARIDPERDVVR